MVLPHDNQLSFDNQDLNWPKREQKNIFQGLHALAWKQQTDFVRYGKIVTLLRKIVEQAKNHKRHL